MDIFTAFALLPAWIFISYAFVLGLFCGSFYMLCIDRYVSGDSIVFPASHCSSCKKKLRIWELIPLLSYVFLRGRCARCGARIGWQTPAVELFSAGLAALIAWKFGASAAFIVFFVAAGCAIVASGIDFSLYILPDAITLGGAVVAPIAAIFVLEMPWETVLAGEFLGAGLFLLVLLLFKKLRGIDGMGLGDVKLMLPLGALCGVWHLPLLVLCSALLALFYYALLALRGCDIRTLRIPFGPFLCGGFFVVILFGDTLWRWWLGIIL